MQLLADAPVRSAPNAFATTLGTQLKNATGTITTTPSSVDVDGDNTRYWEVNFATGVDGWVSGIYLTKVESGATFYVSPTGDPNNSGTSSSQPWPLQHAFDGAPAPGGGPNRIQPGDLIYLLDGIYDVQGGTWFQVTSAVNGTSTERTTFRAFPGARPVLRQSSANCTNPNNNSGIIHVLPAVNWVAFQDLELTNIATSREDDSGIQNCHDYRPNGIWNEGDNVAFVSLLLHDLGVGMLNDDNANGTEIDGNIIFNNGWQKTVNLRPSGHGLYLKSTTGIVARGNVIFNQYGYGIHAYNSDPGKKIDFITLKRNVVFNNGTLASYPNPGGCTNNILLGGENPSTGDVVDSNMTYLQAPERPAVCQNVRIGNTTNDAVVNGTVQVTNNYFVGKGTSTSPWDVVLTMGHWNSATVTNNTIIGCKPGGTCAGTLVATKHCFTSGPLGNFWSWSDNKHYRDPATGSWNYITSPGCTVYNESQTFGTWKNGTQLGLSDLTFTAAPAAQQVFSWGSGFDPKRATVVVYNWTLGGDFTVDLTGKLASGTYRVFNVQNMSAPVGSPVTYSGTGSITLPISLVTPTNPIGSPFTTPLVNDNKFNVYVLMP